MAEFNSSVLDWNWLIRHRTKITSHDKIVRIVIKMKSSDLSITKVFVQSRVIQFSIKINSKKFIHTKKFINTKNYKQKQARPIYDQNGLMRHCYEGFMSRTELARSTTIESSVFETWLYKPRQIFMNRDQDKLV